MESKNLFLLFSSGAIGCLSVASLGIVAACKDKYGLSDTLTAYGILGSILSMFCAAFGCFLFSTYKSLGSSLFGKIYISGILLSQFFLTGYAGFWSQAQNYVDDRGYSGFPQLVIASLGISLTISVLWIFFILVSHFSGVLGDHSDSQQDYQRAHVSENSSLIATSDNIISNDTNNNNDNQIIEKKQSNNNVSQDLERAQPTFNVFNSSVPPLSIGHLFCGFMIIFFAITLGLTAANKDGDAGEYCYTAYDCYKLKTPDVLAGFGITGSVLGLITSMGGLLLPFLFGVDQSYIRSAWLVSALIAHFFIVAAAGIWAGALDQLPWSYDLWNAELAFEIITGFFWSVTIVLYGKF